MVPTPPANAAAFVPGEDPTRVGGRRLVACAIDVGLGVVLYVVLFILLSQKAPVATWVGHTTNICAGRRFNCATFGHRYIDGGRRAVMQFVVLAYLVGVFVIQRGLTGSTLGTRALGIATVGHDGEPIGPARALWRSVAGIVDYLPCCLPIVGIVTIFATTGHRRVGDLAARSVVVDRRHVGAPILVPGLDTGVAAGPATFGDPPVPLPSGPPTGPIPPVPPVSPVGSPTGPPVGAFEPPVGPAGPAPSGPPTGPGGPDAPSATATWPAASDTPGWAAAAAPASPPETPPILPTVTPGAQPYSPPVPPSAEAPAPGSPSATPPPPADPTQPQWDAERGAYIQWDPIDQRWMQFDQATQAWHPI